jgi:Xaa-Pro dipeptidase
MRPGKSIQVFRKLQQEDRKTMCTDRRDFLRLSAGLAGATLLGETLVRAEVPETSPQRETPESIRNLRRMVDGIEPITLAERKSRIEKARRLMKDSRIGAIYLEPGSSMFYFTGMRWGLSERMFGLVIPARGEIAWVCPKFEEERARELIKIGEDIRTWEEDESPYQRVAEIFRDRGLRTGRIGMEERVRLFIFDGIRKT